MRRCDAGSDSAHGKKQDGGSDQEAAEDAQVCPLSQSRGSVVSEGAQEVLSLEGLSVRQLSSGRRATESDGGTSGSPEVSVVNAVEPRLK